MGGSKRKRAAFCRPQSDQQKHPKTRFGVILKRCALKNSCTQLQGIRTRIFAPSYCQNAGSGASRSDVRMVFAVGTAPCQACFSSIDPLTALLLPCFDLFPPLSSSAQNLLRSAQAAQVRCIGPSSLPTQNLNDLLVSQLESIFVIVPL